MTMVLTRLRFMQFDLLPNKPRKKAIGDGSSSLGEEEDPEGGGGGGTTTNMRVVVGGPTKPFYLEPDLRYRAKDEQSSSRPSCPDRYRGSEGPRHRVREATPPPQVDDAKEEARGIPRRNNHKDHDDPPDPPTRPPRQGKTSIDRVAAAGSGMIWIAW